MESYHKLIIAGAALLVLVLLPWGGNTPDASDADLHAHPSKDGSYTLTIPAERMAQCDAGGGCLLVPQSVLEDMLNRAVLHMCGKDV